MPSVTGTVHETSTRLPRGVTYSTMHMRQTPTGSSLGCEQKTGIWMPAARAASTTSVPAGTVICLSSMVRVTVSAIRILRIN